MITESTLNQGPRWVSSTPNPNQHLNNNFVILEKVWPVVGSMIEHGGISWKIIAITNDEIWLKQPSTGTNMVFSYTKKEQV